MLTKAVQITDDNLKNRLTRYIDSAVTTSSVNSAGTKGFAQTEFKFAGVQEVGLKVPRNFNQNTRRRPSRKKAFVFFAGGRSTLVRNSLDSVAPIEGTKKIIAATLAPFEVAPGNWLTELEKDLLNRKDEIASAT